MKKPKIREDCLSHTSTKAVHWLDRSRTPPSIACGTPIPYVHSRSNFTTDREKVTCNSCWPFANNPNAGTLPSERLD